MIPQLIIIEGLIGAGKTTLSEELARRNGWIAMKEPVEDNPYLEKFYKDPRRYALEMQFWLLSRRFKMHQEAIEMVWKDKKTVIMDRSIYGDAVFCKKNFLDDNIDYDGYHNYLHMRDVMFRFLMVPQKTFYLEVGVDTAIDRIEKRGRDCEKAVSKSYLAGLDRLYGELLIDLEERGSHVTVVNWEKPLDQSIDLVTRHIRGTI